MEDRDLILNSTLVKWSVCEREREREREREKLKKAVTDSVIASPLHGKTILPCRSQTQSSTFSH